MQIVIREGYCSTCRDTLVDLIRGLLDKGGDLKPGGGLEGRAICGDCDMILATSANRKEKSDISGTASSLHMLADSMEKNGPFTDDYLRVRALADQLKIESEA